MKIIGYFLLICFYLSVSTVSAQIWSPDNTLNFYPVINYFRDSHQNQIKQYTIVEKTEMYIDKFRNSLVGYWDFNGDCNDISGNGNDGIVTNYVSYVSGVSGYALEFPGTVNGYVTIPNHRSLNFSGSFSICAWVYSYDMEMSSSIISKGRDIINSFSITTGGYNLGFSFVNELYTGEGIQITNFPTYEWHYVVGVVGEDKIIRIYMDGALVHEKYFSSVSYINVYNDHPLVFGRHFTLEDGSGGWEYPFHGKLDEVRIYSKALTNREVEYLYKAYAKK